MESDNLVKRKFFNKGIHNPYLGGKPKIRDSCASKFEIGQTQINNIQIFKICILF